MAIKLLPNQIPAYWEPIKYALVQSSVVSKKETTLFLNKTLHMLLSSKAQCFVVLDRERSINAISLTRIVLDELTGIKSLFIYCLYSFSAHSLDEWENNFSQVHKFAAEQGCKYITMYTSNPRVSSIVNAIGFKERFKHYSMEV